MNVVRTENRLEVVPNLTRAKPQVGRDFRGRHLLAEHVEDFALHARQLNGFGRPDVVLRNLAREPRLRVRFQLVLGKMTPAFFFRGLQQRECGSAGTPIVTDPVEDGPGRPKRLFGSRLAAFQLCDALGIRPNASQRRSNAKRCSGERMRSRPL